MRVQICLPVAVELMYFNHDIKLYDIDSVLNDIGKSRTPLGRVIIYVRQMNYYNDLNLMFL